MQKALAKTQAAVYILFNIFLTAALFMGLYNLGANIAFANTASYSAQEYFTAVTTNRAMTQNILVSVCEIVIAGAVLTKFFKEEKEKLS